MRFITLLFAAFLALVLQSCNESVTYTDENNVISGNIINENNEPIEGMGVHAIDTNNVRIYGDTTNAEGYFILKDLPDSLDNTSILLIHKDYGNRIIKAKEFINSMDSDNRFRISENFLERDCCNYLEVNVKNKEGEPLDDVEVRLNKGKDIIGKLYTDDNGKVVFDSICDGSYWIRIYKSGYKVREIEFAVSDCDTLEKNIELIETDDCCNFSKFVIYDKDGNKIKNAEIKLKKDGKLIEVSFTNENGVAEFDNLCDGKYTYRIYKSEYDVIEGYFEVDNCEDKIIEKELQLAEDGDCCNYLEVNVKNKESEPLDDVEVRLNKGKDIIGKLYTDDNGKVVFDSICDGSYWIRIYKSGYKVREIEVSVDNCEELVKTVILQKDNDCCDNILKVYPKDLESGELIQNSKIILWQNGEKIETAFTGDNAAVIDGICKGAYWVDVIAEGYKSQEFEIIFDCDEVKEIVKKLKISE